MTNKLDQELFWCQEETEPPRFSKEAGVFQHLQDNAEDVLSVSGGQCYACLQL